MNSLLDSLSASAPIPGRLHRVTFLSWSVHNEMQLGTSSQTFQEVTLRAFTTSYAFGLTSSECTLRSADKGGSHRTRKMPAQPSPLSSKDP